MMASLCQMDPLSSRTDGLPNTLIFDFGCDVVKVADYECNEDPPMLTMYMGGFGQAVDPEMARAKVLALLEPFGIKGKKTIWDFCG